MKLEILHIIESTMLVKTEVVGKNILEVGSRNVNGSVRGLMDPLKPKSYLGIDIETGEGVDVLCNVYDIVEKYGEGKFDGVVCTEVLEHVEDWRLAVLNLKTVLKVGGFLIISVPSIGFHYHAYPTDYWRYQLKDIRNIFSDMTIYSSVKLRKGVVAKIYKPVDMIPVDLSDYELYSVSNVD